MLTYKKACEIRQRMHEAYSDACADCPINSNNNWIGDGCFSFFSGYPEEAEKLLTDWDEKNPVRTILDEFKENYPDAKLNSYGYPTNLCPPSLGYACGCSDHPAGIDACRLFWSQHAKK